MPLKLINLALLILLPLSWFAPLMRAGLLPLFGLDEISVVTGLQSLWGTDVILALIVTTFAIFAPWLKTLGLALIVTSQPAKQLRVGAQEDGSAILPNGWRVQAAGTQVALATRCIGHMNTPWCSVWKNC